MSMDTIIDSSKLNNHCRADLKRLLDMYRDNSKSVTTGPTRYDHSTLPSCVDQLTSVKAAITKPPLFATNRPSTVHAVPREWQHDSSKSEKKFFKSVEEKLAGTGNSSEGTFLKKRFPSLPLTAKEQDFIYRYAEHKHGSKVQRGETSHAKSAAYRAYTEAFLSFMGRPPSILELQEADRLNFAAEFDTGKVGVVPHPHAPTPHHHITNTTNLVCACERQVHPPEKPVVKAARPGSTVLSRLQLSPPRERTTTQMSSTAGSSPQRRTVSPRNALPLPPLEESKKNCRLCRARLPPRLVKDICPSCDK